MRLRCPHPPRLDRVALLAVSRDLVHPLIEIDFVLSAPAVDGVLVAVIRNDHVIALAGLDGVLARVAATTFYGIDLVIPAASPEAVVATVAKQIVRTRPAGKRVIAVETGVGLPIANQRVVAALTRQDIVAAVAIHKLLANGASEGIVAIAAIAGDAGGAGE